MKQHSIPQNIMAYEFKLIAGMTVRQFIYIAIGGGIAFVLLMGITKNVIRPELGWPGVIICGIFAFSFAIVKIQDRSLDSWLKDYTNALKTPTRRVWKKTFNAISVDQIANTKPLVYPNYLKIYFQTQAEVEAESLKFINNSRISETLENSNIQQEQSRVQTNQNIVKPANLSSGNQADNQNVENQQVTNIQDTNLQNGNSYNIPESIVISISNANQYAIDSNRTLKQANTSAFIIYDSYNNPIANVIGTLMDSTTGGQIKQALRSNASGIIFFDKQQPNGGYLVNFNLNGYTFAPIQMVYDGNCFPVFKITSKNN